MRLGLIARADDSGLGIQTQRLARLLNPKKVLAIDYREFKGPHMIPHWDRLEAPGRQVRRHAGMLSGEEIGWITSDVDAVLTCEIDYAKGRLYKVARKRGVRSLVQFNYEFLENLRDHEFPVPDVFIAPSKWNVYRLPRYIKERLKYIPLPLEDNWQEEKDSRMFLHVVGKNTHEDRNGTKIVFEALDYTKEDFKLFIAHQDKIEIPSDSRIQDIGYAEDLKPVYRKAAHLVMPRRFGGQSLVIQEAIASNCTPILLDSDPYEIGRKVAAEMQKRIHVYTLIDVYYCAAHRLAKEMNAAIAEPTVHREAMRSYLKQHTFDQLRPQWEEAIKG